MLGILAGLTMLVAAGTAVWLGRPEAEGPFSAAVSKWKLDGALALAVVTLLAVGLALVVSGAVGALP